jgi:hypothetical protein
VANSWAAPASGCYSFSLLGKSVDLSGYSSPREPLLSALPVVLAVEEVILAQLSEQWLGQVEVKKPLPLQWPKMG